jgi:threonine/homoserine/homoserine lactone efflux protein
MMSVVRKNTQWDRCAKCFRAEIKLELPPASSFCYVSNATMSQVFPRPNLERVLDWTRDVFSTDVIVVGNYVGKEALAAVGSTTMIVNMLVFFFNGFSVGAGVVISRLFGQKDLPMLHRAVETTITLTLIICALFTSALSALIPKIRTPMLVLGACYMLYLAWKTFRRPTVIEEKSSPMGFLNGFVLEFMNPKIFIYGIVSMEGYILPYYEGNWPALIAFAILLATIGCFFNICWALFGTIFSVLFSKYGKITNTIMALLLVYCAISLFR